ncbi:MAG: hypothetical protein ACI4M9_03930 [Succinivibrio sp.]
MIYIYEIKKVDGGFVAYVPDVDIETKPQPTEEAAADVLEEAFAGAIEVKYRKQKKLIPLPVVKEGEYGLSVPLKLQLRILLWNTMQEQHVSQTELAEKLGISKARMNQFFISELVSVEKYEEALEALGYTISVHFD